MTAHRTLSPLEQAYGAFSDSTIQAGGQAAPLMRDLNRVQQIVAGLGAVLRIVGGNTVVEDEHDPSHPDTMPPLSKTTQHVLITMAAAICEQLADDIETRAQENNAEVKP
jgi:hypothetical protein